MTSWTSSLASGRVDQYPPTTSCHLSRRKRLRRQKTKSHTRRTRASKKKMVRYGKATRRRRGKGMSSMTRSIPRIDCSRDADQASAEPDDAGPALRGHPTPVGEQQVTCTAPTYRGETARPSATRVSYLYICGYIIAACSCILLITPII